MHAPARETFVMSGDRDMGHAQRKKSYREKPELAVATHTNYLSSNFFYCEYRYENVLFFYVYVSNVKEKLLMFNLLFARPV